MEIATPHSDHRSEKLNINQWAEEDRPREKLMRQGPEALSNAERPVERRTAGHPDWFRLDQGECRRPDEARAG